jgi:hypothetical protein
VATHGGRHGGLFPGRHLFLLAGTAVRRRQLSLAPSHARTAKVAGATFQTSWRQDCFYRAVHFLVPPVAVNLLAGMAKMPWRIFLFYNLTGSAAFTTCYILIGYFFGKKWKLLEAWLGPTTFYLILAGIAFIVLGVIFRHSLSEFLTRLFSKKRKRK